MIDPWNRVMNNLLIAEDGICSNITNTETAIPSEFPALYVGIINNADDAVDLELTETGVRSDIRIESFSDKGLNEARQVMSIACDAMRLMGYRRTFGPRELENVHDRNVRRMEARFRRFVGDLDDIPRFDPPVSLDGGTLADYTTEDTIDGGLFTPWNAVTSQP